MCDGLGRQFSYTCPNATLFQQRMLICDHWYMVNCSKSEVDYRANLLIGQKDKPFVEDSEKQRTPRPDLLTNPSEPEYNLYSRNSRVLSQTNLNKLVGVDTERSQENGSQSTDKPLYFVPSHWSTEYTRDVTTEPNLITHESGFKGRVREKPRGFSKPIDIVKKRKITINTIDNNKFVDTSTSLNAISQDNSLGKKPVHSKIKPNSIVNFPSNFENTTPKFPTFVDERNKKFEIEETPNGGNISDFNLFLAPPKSLRQPTGERTPVNNFNSPTVKVKKQNAPEYPWQDLRKRYFIPDVTFPLEMVPRASYDNALNSFQVKSVPVFVTNNNDTQT
ncbi:uncharacterized protein LOC108732853 isoform X2 [Agrilus planipennis]|nr:uncharacterized protein LOC108732853 isoform X2 [Agrilus planipennis]